MSNNHITWVRPYPLPSPVLEKVRADIRARFGLEIRVVEGTRKKTIVPEGVSRQAVTAALLKSTREHYSFRAPGCWLLTGEELYDLWHQENGVVPVG